MKSPPKSSTWRPGCQCDKRTIAIVPCFMLLFAVGAAKKKKSVYCFEFIKPRFLHRRKWDVSVVFCEAA